MWHGITRLLNTLFSIIIIDGIFTGKFVDTFACVLTVEIAEVCYSDIVLWHWLHYMELVTDLYYFIRILYHLFESLYVHHVAADKLVNLPTKNGGKFY